MVLDVIVMYRLAGNYNLGIDPQEGVVMTMRKASLCLLSIGRSAVCDERELCRFAGGVCE